GAVSIRTYARIFFAAPFVMWHLYLSARPGRRVPSPATACGAHGPRPSAARRAERVQQRRLEPGALLDEPRPLEIDPRSPMLGVVRRVEDRHEPGRRRAGPQRQGFARALVGAPAQERDAPFLGGGADDRQLLLRLGPLEPLQVTRPVLCPGDLFVEKRAQQRDDRAELLEPEVHALLADPARPEAHDEDARAVVLGRRIVNALDRDHRIVRRRTAARLNLSQGSVSSTLGVNQTKSNGSARSKAAG